MDGIHRKQYGSKSNAHQGGAAPSTSSAKRSKGKVGTARGGGKTKPPIKVVYIGNPMRVTTSAAGFRALVQELTGRHADPYKHGGGASAIDAAADAAADDSVSGGSPAGPLQAGGALPSPVSTPSSDAASAHAASAPACYDEEEDSFAPQLIDNSYCVFSPPTFLYGPHGGEL
ncbi:unnamed protein product [Urochloa decumbens]|uniref:VQ domain-containing protein n=1 Tax=Urochloa decumbens TaxID=240449 RepID=A0ABC8VQT1_9POAL